MLFREKTLTLVVATALSSTAAYAATVSDPTPPVVGFKPEFFPAKGSVAGELKVGKTLTVNPSALKYLDKDLDALAIDKVIYQWFIEGETKAFADKASAVIPKEAVGKKLVLKVTPVSLTGDPDTGNALILTNLLLDGATGGDKDGQVTPDNNAKPMIEGLKISGNLDVGNKLSAVYVFQHNGGDKTDKSLYAWGIAGESANNLKDKGKQVDNQKGIVPEYTITTGDVGQVLEVSVKPRNGLDAEGTVVTASTKDIGTDGGKVPFIVADPQSVLLTFKSSAKEKDNGVEGQRPVAGFDTITAEIEPTVGASSDAAVYRFTWMADGTKVAEGDGMYTYKPDPKTTQGKRISVSVEPVKKP
ncbi:hypothetical protein [Aeromonas jandaei]|uniref:hypothetical protein n=1 Tax=Aeromonas jandaei TaxID=650 RepID=UPI003B9E6AFA